MVFKEKERLLSLYNAMNGTSYENPEDLEIVTLENAIYMNVKNDIAFLVDSFLNLYEHQSTFNPNMPLRDLFYVAREYERLTAEKSLHISTKILLPAPRFIVFYNGTQTQPEQRVLKLSDSYDLPKRLAKENFEPELELKVTMLNINLGSNKKLLEACQTLKEYAIYIARIRSHVATMPLEQAVDCAINECINENVLREFLIKYKAEAKSMSIFEYDEEKEMALIREDERRQGVEEGMRRGIEFGISEGATKKLIIMVCRKLQKEKSPEQIAEELEEELPVIENICLAVKIISSYDCDKIYELIKEEV